MGQEGELYRCEICGQEVRVTQAGPGRLYCCGEPMTLVIHDEPDASDEK